LLLIEVKYFSKYFFCFRGYDFYKVNGFGNLDSFFGAEIGFFFLELPFKFFVDFITGKGDTDMGFNSPVQPVVDRPYL
jgi:hypothetical protein